VQADGGRDFKTLPEDQARRIAYGNAERLFGSKLD